MLTAASLNRLPPLDPRGSAVGHTRQPNRDTFVFNDAQSAVTNVSSSATSQVSTVLQQLGQKKQHKDALLYARFSPNGEPELIDSHIHPSLRQHFEERLQQARERDEEKAAELSGKKVPTSKKRRNKKQDEQEINKLVLPKITKQQQWEGLRTREGIFYHYNWYTGEVRYTVSPTDDGKDFAEDVLALRAHRKNPHLLHLERREREDLEAAEEAGEYYDDEDAPGALEEEEEEEPREWRSSDSDYPFEHEAPCLFDGHGYRINGYGRRLEYERERIELPMRFEPSKNISQEHRYGGPSSKWVGKFKSVRYHYHFSHWKNKKTGQRLSNDFPRHFGYRATHD
ncbi:unnamed protein product [Amoebophrya sp. A120]|nr:unnamed protein product [Amoebophrya sp. A120]|eukprot:GSA120T00004770001.1